MLELETLMRAQGKAQFPMRVRRKFDPAGWFGLGLSIMFAACTSDMADKLAGQPCTRSDQCASGLRCSGGSCVLSSRDGGGDDDAGRPGEGESNE